MKKLEVLSHQNKVVGEISLALTEKDYSPAVVHQVMEALRAKKRQGSASVKNKALVSGGGAKPFKQKGSGRARQGSSRSPLNPGGGVVFGPSPRSFEQKVNKKVMKKAIKTMLLDKIEHQKLMIFDTIESSGKTKEMISFLQSKKIESAFVVLNENITAHRALRNILKIKPVMSLGFNVYDALKYDFLIFEKQALEQILGRLE